MNSRPNQEAGYMGDVETSSLVSNILSSTSSAATWGRQQSYGHGLCATDSQEFAFMVVLQLQDTLCTITRDGSPLATAPYRAGTVSIYDLRHHWIANTPEPFEALHFYLPAAGFEDIIHDQHLSRLETLREAPDFCAPDPIVQYLSFSLLTMLCGAEQYNRPLVDHVILGLQYHVLNKYGALQFSTNRLDCRLAPWQLRRAKELLNANIDGSMGIASIAHECGLSRAHFSRAFSHSVGVPPYRWLRTLRIERAKDLLRNSSHSLSEIALICGFTDQSHFNRAFRCATGQTPRCWRIH